MEQDQIKRLYRSRTNRIIFGICGGLGEYFNIDPIIFRLIFAALTLGGGAGILIYIVMAFLIPKEPESNAGVQGGGVDFKNQAQGLVQELKEQDSLQRKNWLGIGIIILGGVLLLDQLLPGRFHIWGFIWPALIITVGILLLAGKGIKKAKEQGQSQSFDEQIFPKEKIQEVHHHHYRKGGGIWRLFFGALLLILGIAFLAQNLDLVPGLDINFDYLWKFWPVLIIFWGLSVLSRGTWLGALLSVIFVLIIISLIISSFFWPRQALEVKNYDFEITRDNTAARAEVTIKSGAAVVSISGGANALASGNLESNVTRLLTSTKTENNVQISTIETESKTMRWTANNFKNNLKVNLSENIPLSLNITSGASTIDFDSSNLELENLNFKSGASKLNLKFGSRATTSIADIDAGVSTINISLPRDLGARINTKTGLSSQSFIDFRQTGENTFESINYASSTKNIQINLEAGVSSISVTWR